MRRCVSAPGGATVRPTKSPKSVFVPAAFRLEVAVEDIPHPEKAIYGGEDAYFVCDMAVGVADGVGGWQESGVNPKEVRVCVSD